MSDAPDNLVTLFKSNRRDPVAVLRAIADNIEAGKYGEVGAVGVVVKGNTVEVFGAGTEDNVTNTGMLLHAGFLRLALVVERHGRN